MRFALIRHGQYEQISQAPSALQPYPLTIEGVDTVRKEAEAFRNWVEHNAIALNPEVHCSSLLRAWQTANIFIDVLSDLFPSEPKLTESYNLCERSVGAVANLTVTEIERLLELDPRFEKPPAGWKSDSFYQLPFDGAESLIESGERAKTHIENQCSKDPEALTLFVGHGAAFRHAAYHLNVIKLCDIKKLSMHYGHPVAFELTEKGDVCELFGAWKQRTIQDAID